ncbi:MAG: DUF433 domain-containing protein [Planctomycetota bacterium]
MSSTDVIDRSPDVLSGTAVFRGTRVPVQTLLDYLEADQRIDDFLADFPTVSRDQAIAVLELAREALTSDARPR